MKKIIFALFLLLIVHCTLQIENCSSQWEQCNGPAGCSVTSMLVSGSNIFAGTSSGIFRSINNGTNWDIRKLPNYLINDFCINGSNLYAAGDGVYISTDNGLNWTGGTNFANGLARCITTSGSNIYIGTDIGVYFSSNNGVNWSYVGLSDHDIYSLKINGTTLFAGTDFNGMYRSTDSGMNWTSCGPSGLFVPSIVVSGSYVFAGTNMGFFLSTNNGLNWINSNNGLTNLWINKIFVSGPNVYAGTDSGAYVSTNNGNSWTPINNGLSYQSVLSFSISGSYLFAGTMGGGVFRSTNNGLSWTSENNGLYGQNIFDFCISGSSIIAGSDMGGGIFISSNNGTNWNDVNNGLTIPYVYALTVSGTNIFAGTINGIFRSTNNCSSWEIVNNGLTNLYINTLASSGTYIFAGTQQGFFLSSNNGSTWIPRNNGMGNLNIKCIMVYGSILFVGSPGGGVYRSTDYGSNWNSVNNGITNLFINALTVSGSNIYVGAGSGGVFRSTNNGTNWVAVNNGLPIPSILVTSFAVSGSNLFLGSDGGVYLTTNNGENWIQKNQNLSTTNIQSLETANGYIFVGTSGYSVLRRSLSEILTSYSISGTVKYSDNNQPVISGYVKAFKLDKSNGNIIILDSTQINSNGTYTLPNVPQDSCSIGVFPNSTPQPDYVITYYPSTIYWQGATVIYPTGNLTNINISAIRMITTTASNSVSGKVMRLTDTYGNLKDAFVYAKNGNTFVKCGVSDVNGVFHLPSLPSGNLKIIVNRLGFSGDSTNVNVLASSNIDSINFTLNNLYTGIKPINNEVPNEYKLYQNYPNPFNPVTKIRFEVPLSKGGSGVVSLKIYDITGREITTLINESLNPGTYEITFDGNNLSSGIYFYRIQTKSFSDTKRMVFIK